MKKACRHVPNSLKTSLACSGYLQTRQRFWKAGSHATNIGLRRRNAIATASLLVFIQSVSAVAQPKPQRHPPSGIRLAFEFYQPIRQAPRLRVPTGFADGASVQYSLASLSKAPTPVSLHSTKVVVPLAFDQRRCQLIIRDNDNEKVPQIEVIALPATIRSQLGSDNALNGRGPC